MQPWAEGRCWRNSSPCECVCVCACVHALYGASVDGDGVLRPDFGREFPAGGRRQRHNVKCMYVYIHI